MTRPLLVVLVIFREHWGSHLPSIKGEVTVDLVNLWQGLAPVLLVTMVTPPTYFEQKAHWVSTVLMPSGRPPAGLKETSNTG